MALLAAALNYARAGLPVFPCIPRGKKPAIAHGFQAATTDAKTITDWWKRNPAFNIGVPTSGYFIVDVDGSRELSLPDTLVCKTYQGRHYWYRQQSGAHIKCSQHKDLGFDVRADGGYVLVPPSVHPSGALYQWINGFDITRIADFSERILSLLSKTPHDEMLSITYKLNKAGLSHEQILRCARALNVTLSKPRDEKEIRRMVVKLPENVSLPVIEPAGLVFDDWPEHRAEIISNILRQGHKAQLSGGSKTAKSFFCISLALCVATGTPWFDFGTLKSKVLFLNLEIDRISFGHRVKAVCEARNITELDNLYMWNLRDVDMHSISTLDQLLASLPNEEYGLVIIDPLYQLYPTEKGFDENATGAFIDLYSWINRLIAKTGAAVLHVSHHSKGVQGAKDVIDRVSGSGVQGRDADAILCLSTTEFSDGYLLEMVLREFPQVKPMGLKFEYPLHVRDIDLDNSVVRGGKKPRPKPDKSALLKAYEDCKRVDGFAPMFDLVSALGWGSHGTFHKVLIGDKQLKVTRQGIKPKEKGEGRCLKNLRNVKRCSKK